MGVGALRKAEEASGFGFNAFCSL